jgi:FMN phosphatase YigB (HAD superfamily)
VIVSNHVPELPQLVDALGLGGLVDRVFSSALTGYEKPHPQAYLHALRECGRPAARWMVGNNPLADVAGAEAVGIPAILVRSTRDGMRSAPDLATAAAIVLAGGVEPDPDALTGYGHVSPGPLRLTGSAVAGRPTRR